MPKVTNTRKQRALELQRRIERGPSIAMPGRMVDAAQIADGHKIWYESWIKRELIDLIPELRKQRG